MALLHRLVETGFRNLVVCHLNHRLRGAASGGDARFVRALARRLGLSFEFGVADVRERMIQRGESLETAAREARHAFLADCARRQRCPRVLLAHHADDQAETVLWNLMRGSHGLLGMAEETEIKAGTMRLRFFRPLLHCRHAELVGWLEERGLRWREDASNQEAIGVRNRLRNEVIPLLAEVTGRDPVVALTRAAEDFAAYAGWLNCQASGAAVLDPLGRLHLPTLRSLPSAVRTTVLREFLSKAGVKGITRDLLGASAKLIDPTGAASVNLPGGGRLRRTAGRIWIER